jgi:hypothetical protein
LFQHPASGRTFIGYEDGTVDFFTELGRFETYYDIRNNRTFPSKRINDFASIQSRILLATDFGLVEFDPVTRRTRGSYTQFAANVNAPIVKCVAVYNDTIWAGVQVSGPGNLSGLYAAPANHLNLADGAAWSRVGSMNQVVTGLAACPTGLYAQMANELYLHTPTTGWDMEDRAIYNASGAAFRGLRPYGDYVLVATDKRGYRVRPGEPPITLGPSLNILQLAANPSLTHYAYLDNNRGLTVFDAQHQPRYVLENTFPINNQVHSVLVSGRMLAIAPNGDGSNEFDINGFRLYDLANERGVNLRNNEYGVPDYLGAVSEMALDSANQRLYIGTWDHGILEFSLRDSQVVQVWNGTNSSLRGETFSNGIYQNIRITGLGFDSRGNLYATAFRTIGLMGLSVRTPDGQWRSREIPERELLGLYIDSNDNVWIWTRDGGMYLFNDGPNVLSDADDRLVNLNSNPGQGALLSPKVNEVVQDQQGAIWAATQLGVSVFYSPQATLNRSAGGDATCPIYLGYCLLNETPVTAIAVDGANRKWIGTATSGLFLFNRDGTELIGNFTAANSPLPSNAIKEITIDPATGEVFIGTSLGLVAYQGNVPNSFPTLDNLLAFPNPVESGYSGVITIRGTVNGARTRILTPSGMLVRDLEAQGGQAEWDGKDVRGNRAQPGVYVVQCITPDGALAGHTKLVLMGN